MRTIIAIDPSLSATGLVVWRDGRPLHIETIRVAAWESAHGWEHPQRHAAISGQIMDFTRETSRCVAVIEGMVKPSAEMARGTSTLDLARLRGVIECDLYRAGVPLVSVHTQTLKAYALPGRPSKGDMIRAAREHLPVRYPITDDNQADAFWLMAMAMHAYGHPIVPVTPRRITFVAKAKWRPFSMGVNTTAGSAG